MTGTTQTPVPSRQTTPTPSKRAASTSLSISSKSTPNLSVVNNSSTPVTPSNRSSSTRSPSFQSMTTGSLFSASSPPAISTTRSPALHAFSTKFPNPTTPLLPAAPTPTPDSTSLPNPPSSPSKLPPFSPRKPISLTQPLFIPPPLTPEGIPSLAQGLVLIVRGVGAENPNSNAVSVMENTIKQIKASNPTLAETPLVVRPFSQRNDWTPSCYVHLDEDALRENETSPNPEPRVDLLEPWIDALNAHNPHWEAAWSPSNPGQDKRMWLRFPQLGEAGLAELKITTEDAKSRLMEWFRSAKIPFVSSFANKGGIIVTLGNPTHVDTFLNGEPLQIKGIKVPLKPLAGRQAPILNAFEVAIAGLETSAYANLKDHITKWILDNTLETDDDFSEPTLAGTRIPIEEPDFLVLYFTTWKATAYALSSSFATKFMAEIGTPFSLHPPKPLFVLNSTNLRSKPTVVKSVNDAADKVSLALSSLKKDFNDFRAETNMKFDMASQQLNLVTNSVKLITDSVSTLQQSFVSSQRALLAQSMHAEKLHSIDAHRAMLLECRFKLITSQDPEEKANLEALILQTEKTLVAMKSEAESTKTNFRAALEGSVVMSRSLSAPPSANLTTAVGNPPEHQTAPSSPKKRRFEELNDASSSTLKDAQPETQMDTR